MLPLLGGGTTPLMAQGAAPIFLPNELELQLLSSGGQLGEWQLGTAGGQRLAACDTAHGGH